MTVRVHFPAPPEEVFDHLGDPRRRPGWQSSLRAVDMIDDGPPRLGMRWRDKTAIGAVPELEITRFDRPRVWSEVGTWRGIHAELDLLFTPDGTGTAVTAEVRLSGDGRWALPAQLLEKLAPLGIRSDLRRAARGYDTAAD